MSQLPTKRIFTLSTFADSARALFAHLDELHTALTQRRISRPFAEKIMMAGDTGQQLSLL